MLSIHENAVFQFLYPVLLWDTHNCLDIVSSADEVLRMHTKSTWIQGKYLPTEWTGGMAQSISLDANLIRSKMTQPNDIIASGKHFKSVAIFFQIFPLGQSCSSCRYVSGFET